MIIHRGKYHDRWCMNAPRRVLVHSSKKGYINKQLFTEYGKMLLCHLHAQSQLDRPNLMVMDSHYSHTFNYCYMNMMYTHDIKVIGIKPHTSHLNQPLYKNPFASLKDSFNSEMHKYSQKHGRKALAKEHFFEVFNVAWEKSMTKRNN